MHMIKDLLLTRGASSAIAFRERGYNSIEGAQMLQDVLALANAEVEGPRFLFLGVRDVVGGKRSLLGLTGAEYGDMQRVMPGLVARSIAPPFKIAIRAIKVGPATIGLLCLSECDNPPYLLCKNVVGLTAGSGWVRRGTEQFPLPPQAPLAPEKIQAG